MNLIEFRVIIAGSRSYNDYRELCKIMDNLLQTKRRQKKIVIICGMARGADMLGARYAQERKYTIRYFPAQWEKYGKAAGYIRNEEMAKNADALVAFWDGESQGTRHMITIAKNHNLAVRVQKFKKIKDI